MNTPLLKQLAALGKTGTLVAKGVPGGFVLVMRDGLDEPLLEAQRGHSRVFRKLDAVASFLRGIGVQSFDVEMQQWVAESLQPSRL